MENFWIGHGYFFGPIFLFVAMIFPRLTLLLLTSVPLGVLGWVGWFFLPRFVIAYYATVYYGDTNPLLCALAWIIAVMILLGEGVSVILE